MVREAWWATVHGVTKQSDTTEQLTHIHIAKLPYRNVPDTFLLFLFVLLFKFLFVFIWLCGMWDPSSLNRGQTRAPCSRSTEF